MSSLLIAIALLAAPATAQPLVVVDMEAVLARCGEDSELKYDTLKLISALQGIVNREQPRLVIQFLRGSSPTGAIHVDAYWLDRLRHGWLKDREVLPVDTLEALLAQFPEALIGAVVWDPAVPATSNVAATACGVEGWLPIRSGSALYTAVVDAGPKLPVKLSLVGRFDGRETGSAKCDAYLWAKREYLDQGRCNDALLAYYVDAFTQRPKEPGFQYPDLDNAVLANQDYTIANRAFTFDLSPWADEVPNDDPNQPLGTDRATFAAILKSLVKQNGGKRIATVCGFTPWNQKYTDHGNAGGKHGGVPTEWEHAALVSAHNAVMDADALGLSGLANASAYQHYPLKERYTQTPPPRRMIEPKTYVLVYMGDYDSAAWLSRNIPNVWDDPARGTLPMAWAFNPNLSDRVPYVFDHIYATRTDQDWFIGGDSGAGYLNPNLLTGDRLGSGLSDALDLWVAHNQQYYARFDYSITGFVINGFHGDMPLNVQEAYAKFSPRGVGMQLGFEKPLVNGAPFLRHARDIYPDQNNLDKTADEIGGCATGGEPQFLIFRMILEKPSTVAKVIERVNARHGSRHWEFCDPYTFFDLYKQYLQQAE
jgi:hypothetical protein